MFYLSIIFLRNFMFLTFSELSYCGFYYNLTKCAFQLHEVNLTYKFPALKLKGKHLVVYDRFSSSLQPICCFACPTAWHILAPESRVENSAQVLSCLLKYVDGPSYAISLSSTKGRHDTRHCSKNVTLRK